MDQSKVHLNLYVFTTVAVLLGIVIGVAVIHIAQPRIVIGSVASATRVTVVIDREYTQHHSAAYTIMVGKVPVRFPSRTWERWDEIARHEFSGSREVIREYTACHDMPNVVVGDRCSDIETTYDYLIRLEGGRELVYRSQLFMPVRSFVDIQLALFSDKVVDVNLHR